MNLCWRKSGIQTQNVISLNKKNKNKKTFNVLKMNRLENLLAIGKKRYIIILTYSIVNYRPFLTVNTLQNFPLIWACWWKFFRHIFWIPYIDPVHTNTSCVQYKSHKATFKYDMLIVCKINKNLNATWCRFMLNIHTIYTYVFMGFSCILIYSFLFFFIELNSYPTK